jgi:hypothetical protein
MLLPAAAPEVWVSPGRLPLPLLLVPRRVLPVLLVPRQVPPLLLPPPQVQQLLHVRRQQPLLKPASGRPCPVVSTSISVQPSPVKRRRIQSEVTSVGMTRMQFVCGFVNSC